MGRPKALIEPWLEQACELLRGAGCTDVLVVLGASAPLVAPLVPAFARAVIADDWTLGMGASLRAGLRDLRPTDAGAALITLVDLPDLTPAAALLVRGEATPTSLRQGWSAGRPAHPVLIGRDHWPELIQELHGDRGARGYLDAHAAIRVDLTDLDVARDADTPADLR